MKLLKEGLLNKKNIRNVKKLKNFDIEAEKFGVSERDLKGEIKDLPFEIFLLALKRQKEQLKSINVKALQEGGLVASFTWGDTEEGHYFWGRMNRGDYDMFYEMYPEFKENQ